MNNSLKLLLKGGLKKTAFRLELLQLFQSANHPMSAAQIFESLRKNKRLKADKFDRATLFRNLKMLVEKGILNATEFGTGAAFYCLNIEHHHHHHVYCIDCETVQSLLSCEIGPMVRQAEKMGFQILNHRLELMGRCERCR